MKKESLIRTIFFLGFATILLSITFRINHSEYAVVTQEAAIVLLAVFVGLAIYEVLTSKHLKQYEKVCWIAGLLFLAPLASIIYFLMRKRYVTGDI